MYPILISTVPFLSSYSANLPRTSSRLGSLLDLDPQRLMVRALRLDVDAGSVHGIG